MIIGIFTNWEIERDKPNNMTFITFVYTVKLESFSTCAFILAYWKKPLAVLLFHPWPITLHWINLYTVDPASFCFLYLFPFSWQLLWTDCMNLSQGSHGVFASINMPDKGLWILTALHILLELFTNILTNIYFSVPQKKGSYWHFIYRLWGIMGYLSS